MNLYKDTGEWSDELVADAAKLGVAPNRHPLALALPVVVVPPRPPDPPPVAPPLPTIDAPTPVQPEIPAAVTPSTVT